MKKIVMSFVSMTLLLFAGSILPAQSAAKPLVPGVLTHEQAAAILPATVFFRGQSALVQGRNAGGFRLDDGLLVLAAIVDTGGYSTAIQQTYQGYLITEVPLQIEGRVLAPGAFGFGFVGDHMVVMDVGNHKVLDVPTTRDAALARPNPLQIVANGTGRFKLYLGRSFVTLTPNGKS